MNTPFPMVRLGEVLAQYTEFIEAPEPRLYPKLSVRLYGRGVVLDTPVHGAALKMKRHQVAKAGQVILSEIWGKKGAIGYVPPSGDGALCTSHFFLFDVHTEKIDPSYLQAIFTANYLENQLDGKAKGTTGYAAVRPKHLLAAAIPLPPLDEQRRIVARIEALAAKIEEARELHEEIRDSIDRLYRGIVFGSTYASRTLTAMGELVRLRPADVVVRGDESYCFAGVYSFGRGVFPSQSRSGLDISYQRLCRLTVGDLVYPKLMAWEGAIGIVPPECDGLYVSTEFPVFEVDRARVLPEVLDVHFRTPDVWPLLASISTGTNVRRRRLNPADFLAFRIPLPPMSAQIQLREVKKKGDRLIQLLTDSSTELDALLPSILDKAFKGEL